jgi:flagellar basal body-associated protein FliL
MSKKVTLDTLDIEETSVSLRAEPAEAKTQEEKPSARWFTSLWFRASCGAFLILLFIIGLSYWWISSKKTVASAPKVLGSVTVTANPNVQFVSDFFIPLKVDKGDQRVMMFDLAFELNSGQQGLFTTHGVRIRSSIYQMVSKKTANVALSPGNMNLLRDEIMAELETYLGKGMIKKIYFTKYIVL